MKNWQILYFFLYLCRVVTEVPEAFTNVEVWTTSCPKVTRDDVERWRLTRADEALPRSPRLLADCRKKLVFWLAAVPKLSDEEESVKVTVFPETEMASIGPEEAKVKAGPLIVVPCAVIVVVADDAGVEVIYLLPP